MQSPLIAALLGLANSMPTIPPSKPNPTYKAADIGKTRKGATHVVGAHFKPKYLIFIDGKHVTPAMYRRKHLGVKNPRKANGSNPII